MTSADCFTPIVEIMAENLLIIEGTLKALLMLDAPSPILAKLAKFPNF
ncbi:hypothetical protein [Suttonella indologenes]|nr:hypothetical protein [Suttonella indologenes]